VTLRTRRSEQIIVKLRRQPGRFAHGRAITDRGQMVSMSTTIVRVLSCAAIRHGVYWDKAKRRRRGNYWSDRGFFLNRPQPFQKAINVPVRKKSPPAESKKYVSGQAGKAVQSRFASFAELIFLYG
jgi:hypothetical protein